MIFEFSWSWYEDYCPILLEGPEKIKEEFEADCKKAMAEVFDKYMEQMKKEDSWAQLPRWVEVASVKLEDYGYKIFKPVRFGCFGLYIPKNDRYSDKNYHDEDEDQFPEFKEQIKKMKKHNNEMDEERYEDIYKQVDKEEKEKREGENNE